MRPETERIISDLESLKVYFDPLRIRIMQLLGGSPRTIHEVAAALDVPFTRLYYQFNLLEKHGFIRVVETRALAGAVAEKYYQMTARLFTVDRALLTLGSPGEEGGLDVVLRTVFDESKADLHRSVQAGLVNMQERPPHPDALLAKRTIVNLSPERARYYHEKLRAIAQEMAAEPYVEANNYYAFSLILYPTIFTMSDSDDPLDET